MHWFLQKNPVMQSLLATLFTYAVTALGASFVFLFKRLNQKILNFMMGFSAGVMIAASYWSLLEPAITLSESLNQNAAFVAAMGFTLGGIFILCSDLLSGGKKEHKKSSAGGCLLLVTAVTMHNIPEGLAVGVAFGNAALSADRESLTAAIMLAIGIGLQNFPEGTCVAMPLRKGGLSRMKCFFIGQFSGMVEPIAGVFGALFALHVENALPLALSFSAGAMISVVCSELIPESFTENKQLATCGILVGFVLMMVLDVSLG